jgi:RHS repeat-associated protein
VITRLPSTVSTLITSTSGRFNGILTFIGFSLAAYVWRSSPSLPPAVLPAPVSNRKPNIAFTWKVIGTSAEGTGVVAANSEAIFQTPTQGEANALNTVRIFTDTSGTADDTRVSSPVTCAGPEATATPLSTTTSERTITYGYDSLYRLKQASYNEGGVVNNYLYEYDLRSNRVSATAPGQSAVIYAYNLANQLTNTGYTYDPNGNLTNDGVNGYIFDAANRLRKVTQGANNTEFTYDGEGNRLKLNDKGVNTDYLLDLSGSLSATLREQQDSAQTWYLNGLDVIGQETASGWTYFGYDSLGSVRHLMDATGQLTYRADYDPYGVPVPTAVQPGASTSTLGFTGEPTDPTGLLYLRARYMNPQTGMFLSGDPVEGTFGRSASRNGYGYVEGNPPNDGVGERQH